MGNPIMINKWQSSCLLLLLCMVCFWGCSTQSKLTIVCEANAPKARALAAREVQRYLYLRTGQVALIAEKMPQQDDAIFIGSNDKLTEQQYQLKTTTGDSGKVLHITGGSDVATLYGAYHFAEKLGVRFYLHGDVIPDKKIAFKMPVLDEKYTPLFRLRGLNPWGSHSEGMDVWDTDDWKQVFGQMAKMRMNFLGVHSYPENPKPHSQYDSEATVWIGLPGDFDEQGKVEESFSASYFNSLRDQWGYIRRPTGEYRFGTSLLFERDDWGTSIMLDQCPVPTTPEGCNAVFNRAGQMFNQSFTLARQLGVKTCIGTEAPLTIPEALKARLVKQGKDPTDPKVVTEVYEGMFRRIAAMHPLDYYWIWTPEKWLWSGNTSKETQAFIDDFKCVRKAWEAAGKPFELATCGWVLGPKGDRAGWVRAMADDVTVSALSEAYSGPVDPAFNQIKDREKWAIPWMEEDNGILGPQLWVSRIRKDAADALAYRCTGLMGLHWRMREIEPQVAALAKAGWSQAGWNPQAGNDPPGVPQTLYYEGPKPPYGRSKAQVATVDRAIAGTEDDALYQSYRYNLCGYRLKVPNGRYRVTLKFFEPEHKADGKRVFDVQLQDQTVLEKLDIHARAGHLKAMQVSFDDVRVENGWLHLGFEPIESEPCIAAIEIAGVGYVRKINCGGMAYKDYQADPPRTKTFNHGPAGMAYEQRGLPCDDLYDDWALHNFGKEAGPAIAAVFKKLDGCVPLVSRFDGGAGALWPDTRPWELVEKEFGFLDEMESLRSKVRGAGNRDRYEYWMNMFRHLKAQARLTCEWGVLTRALDKAKSETDPAKRRQIIENEVLPLREEMTRLVGQAYVPLLQMVSTPGSLATVMNWEGHVYRRMVKYRDAAIVKVYGQSLPEDRAQSKVFAGKPRLIVPTVRTHIESGESLKLKVIVLDNERPKAATLHWRPMGRGEYQPIQLKHVARGVHTVTIPPSDQAFEYYISATTRNGEKLIWPAAAPRINQTVVVLPESD